MGLEADRSMFEYLRTTPQVSFVRRVFFVGLNADR